MESNDVASAPFSYNECMFAMDDPMLLNLALSCHCHGCSGGRSLSGLFDDDFVGSGSESDFAAYSFDGAMPRPSLPHEDSMQSGPERSVKDEDLASIRPMGIAEERRQVSSTLTGEAALLTIE
jgi:hypothetical protein